ncbi:MAG: MFS transporter [Thermoleophilaceae bacterium]|nr:MFS transporter [Thermoleophilaceae bacterium]
MRRLLILCSAVVFLDAVFFAALTPLLPDFRRDLGISEASAGLLSGSYAAGALVCALPGGWFAAHFGPRRAVILGLVGIGIFSPIFGLAESLWLLNSSRFLQGASGALLWAGAMSWIVIAGPEERRGALVGTLIAAATVGELLGSPIGALAHEIGLDIVFGAVAVIAAALLALAMTNRPVHPADPQSPGYAIRAARGSGINSAMWLLAAPSFAFGVCVVVAPLRLDDLGGSPLLIAAAFASGSLVETLLGPLIGRASDKVGRTRPYRAGMLIGAVGIMGIGALTSISLVFAAVVLCAFSAGMAFAPSIALIADAAAGAGIAQGYASGISNAAWGGGQMLGAFGGGALAGAGFIVPAIATVIVLGVAGFVAGRTTGLRAVPAVSGR